jgi:hypothetical protein
MKKKGTSGRYEVHTNTEAEIETRNEFGGGWCTVLCNGTLFTLPHGCLRSSTFIPQCGSQEVYKTVFIL